MQKNAWGIKKPQRVLWTEFVLFMCFIISQNQTKVKAIFSTPQNSVFFICLFRRHRPTNSAFRDARLMRHFRLFQSVAPIRPGI